MTAQTRGRRPCHVCFSAILKRCFKKRVPKILLIKHCILSKFGPFKRGISPFREICCVSWFLIFWRHPCSAFIAVLHGNREIGKSGLYYFSCVKDAEQSRKHVQLRLKNENKRNKNTSLQFFHIAMKNARGPYVMSQL